RFESGDAPILTRESKRWSSQSVATLGSQISRSLTLQLGVSNGITRFQDPTLFDSETLSGSAGLQKSLTRRQSVSTGYSYSRFQISAPQQPEVHSNAQGLQAGWSYNMEKGTS